MKKTQVKDATRNIKKNLLSWISVVFIAAMAASSYLGICYSAASMRNAGDSFYQRTSYRDFEVTSSLLLTGADVDALAADDDVRDVEGIYFANAKVSNGDVHENVNVVSVSERINVPELVEGSLPQKADECALEQTVAEKLGYQVGDTVTACDEQGDAPKFLKGKEYTVTGIALHPDHLAKPDFAPGNRYVLVAPAAFDDEELDGCFMRAEVVLKSTEGMSRFSDEYKKKTDAAKERLNEIADERASLRTAEIRDKYQTEIDDGQKKLDDAKEKLDDGKTQLDEGKETISENEEKLKNAKTELDNGKQTLDSSKAKLDSAEFTLSTSRDKLDAAEDELYTSSQKLTSAKAEIDANREKLEAAKAELDANKQKLDEAEETLGYAKELLDIAEQALNEAKSVTPEELAEMTPEERETYEAIVAAAEELYQEGLAAYNEGKQQFDEGKAKYDSALAQYEESKAKFDSAVAQYEEGKAQYEAGIAEYYSGLSQYESGLAEYNSGKSQYDEGVAKYNENKKKYDDGVKALEEGKETLADKEKEYDDGVGEYKDGVRKLDDAKKSFDELKDCSWFVFDIGSNGGYMHLSLSAKSISNLSVTFSLFFVVIAALVIYTTIKRIVDEQRNLVGATKALGFYNSEILGKYLIFGVSATIVGALIGILAGYFVIQGVVLNSYGNMYVIGKLPAGILAGTSVIAVGLAIVLAIVAVTISCLSLMRSTAMDLMREKQPEVRKSSKSSKSGSSLYSRLILRNMRSDLARVIVTTVSVAGCCALLVIGFTLRGSVSSVADKQYGEIVKYDERLTFNPGASDDVEKEIEAILDDAGTKWVKAQSGFRAFKAGSDVEYTDLICGDMEALSEFYNFKTWKKDSKLPTDEDGVFIQCRTTETAGKDSGDDIIIYDGTMSPYEVKVAGVFNNYMGRNMIMNEASYEKYFGEQPKMNTYFLYLNGADKDQLVEKLDRVKGYESLAPAAEDKGKLELVTNVFNKVAILLLVIAGLMAYFILLNITKMYVNQKTRELTIMRINGFTVKEVKRYLNTETIITSVIGILLGIAVGALMGYIVIRFIEMPHAQFVRTPYWLGWLISAAITAAFTAAITAFGTRKVKDLKLTDA
ncbi:ABC transporter permease [Ruminococcus sp.]|uniref:ABC transporter permease n=1 Tax=Ruminococcus sp. TaxID=41978 RepID=UPI002E815820|nr:FtsX-like permease family protein [Ruminococcus sp.]MEE3493295.1 FtsX-like permease family protein [Ruminococcus sp.]